MLRLSLLAAVFTAGWVAAASAATMDFTANLTAASEVPPKTSSGFGDLLATLDTTKKELSYTLTFDGLTGPATAAHFHGPAAVGANAGVVVPIGGANPTSPAHGTATLTDAQIKDLEAGKWYVNVHTAANPGGEIRGQVTRGGAPAMKTGGSKPMPTKSSSPVATPSKS
jgi:hypothetical protein